MNAEEIIKKNKAKRNSYLTNTSASSKKPNLAKNILYLKGLITRTLLTIIFVLGSIIFTNISASNKKLYQKYVLEDSLEFTKINNLYHDLFGEVNFLKNKEEPETPVFSENLNFTSIEKYNNSFKLAVKKDEAIKVLTSGIIVFMGTKDTLGETIIVQGNDGVDIWYSNIANTDLSVYDYVTKDTIIGSSLGDYIYLTFLKDGEYLSYDEYQQSI